MKSTWAWIAAVSLAMSGLGCALDAESGADEEIASHADSTVLTGGILAPGQALYAASQDILSSSDNSNLLQMQSNGDLVLYNLFGGLISKVWASNTAGKGANRVVMQVDGNLVIYTPTNIPVWATGTASQ